MTSGSKFIRKGVYDLLSIPVGDTKRFEFDSEDMKIRIRRSANNHNARGNGYFTTRVKDGAIYITRIR